MRLSLLRSDVITLFNKDYVCIFFALVTCEIMHGSERSGATLVIKTLKIESVLILYLNRPNNFDVFSKPQCLTSY